MKTYKMISTTFGHLFNFNAQNDVDVENYKREYASYHGEDIENLQVKLLN